MKQPVYAVCEGVELTERELETILFIRKYVEAMPYGLQRPPSHTELLTYLRDRGFRLISTQQTQRIILSLRDKGLLMPSEELAGWIPEKSRNMVLTDDGRRLAIKLAQPRTLRMAIAVAQDYKPEHYTYR